MVIILILAVTSRALITVCRGGGPPKNPAIFFCMHASTVQYRAVGAGAATDTPIFGSPIFSPQC